MAIPSNRRRLTFWLTVVPIATLSIGCSTTIIGSANPLREKPSQWADFDHIPFVVRGSAPGVSNTDLAALFPRFVPTQYASLGDLPAASTGRHIILYVNAANLPANSHLCAFNGGYAVGLQTGRLAKVTGALCDGGMVVTCASGRVLTQGQTPTQLQSNFKIISEQLYDSLYPGANDPTKNYY